MAKEEPNQLNYVAMTVLKKRKDKEDWVVKRMERLDAKKKRKNDEYKFIPLKGMSNLSKSTVYPNLKSVKELIYKKDCGSVEKVRHLGQCGMIYVEDVVHEIAINSRLKMTREAVVRLKMTLQERERHWKP